MPRGSSARFTVSSSFSRLRGFSRKSYAPSFVACTAVLMKNDTFKTVYPNKVFDYMSCRRPVIIAIDGVARKLVQDAGAGLYVEPENPAQFIAAVKQLQADPALCQKMGDQGYLHAATYYSREGMAKKYLAVLEKLTG